MNTVTADWFLEASRWLWDYFLLATVLLAVVLVLGKFLAQPARRMAVHWSTAAGLLLLALLCAVPGWSVVNLLSAASEPPPVFRDAPFEVPLDDDLKQLLQDPNILPPSSYFEPTAATQSPALSAPTKTITIDYGLLISCAVAAGSILFSLWLTLGHWQMRRLRSQAKPAPPELEALLPQFIPAGQRTPTLGIVEKLPVAAAVGLRRPMVLLPKNFLELADPEKLQSVLAHELAHIRHRDLWLLALLRGLLLVLWPHPLYWLWRRGVRLDQETLADAAAADVTDRTHYAEQLVAWARVATESRTPRLASSVGLWESPSQLKRRIAILLDEKLTVLRACSRRWRVGSALGMLAIAGGLSLITLSPAEPQTALAESNEPTKLDEKPGFSVTLATPPADSSEESSSTAVSKPTSNTPTPPNDVIIQFRQQHFQRLHKLRKPNTIIGICLDEKGRPLADVPIEVYVRRLDRPEKNPKPILETTSDAKGEFFFADVVDVAKDFPDGLPDEHFQGTKVKIFNVQGRLEGRVPGIGSNTWNSIARHGSTLAWVMSPAKVLRGRVTDNTDQPVAGAKVAVGFYATQGGSPGINSAITNANGGYVINDLPTEDLFGSKQIFLVRHPKFAVRHARIIKIPGKLDVQLVPGSVIEGNVRLPEGETTTKKSLVGSLVHLQRALPQPKPGEQPDAFSYQVEKTTVDEQGHYRFASLPASKYHLTADVEGWVTQGVENVEVAQGETVTAPDIMLMHGGRVLVQLVDSKTGEPMRFENPTKGFMNAQLRPHRAGIFAFRNNIVDYSTEGLVEFQVPAGNYTFHASIPNPDRKSDLNTVLPEAMDEWPVEKVVDGELLKILMSMEARERKIDSNLATSFYAAETPSDEAAADKSFGQSTFLEGLQIAADEGVLVCLDPQRLAHNSILPDDLSVHAAYQFNPRNVIAKLKRPFDDRAGYKDAFAHVLQGLEKDPYGPQINVKKEFIANLTGLITVVTFAEDANAKEPTRRLVAAKTNNEKALKATVDKFMRNDPNASLANMNGWPVWKIVNEQVESSLASVVLGHLFVSNDAELMQKVFAKNPKAVDSAKESDFNKEVTTGDKPISEPSKDTRVDRTYMDDRFIFCPVKTELQRNLLGISRGKSEEASLCVLVHSEALKTKSGMIDRKALGYPNITKRLKEYSKKNNHLVVFSILGSVNTGEPYDDIHDRMNVLSWAFKGLGQHAGFRQCQAPTTYGVDWEKMVARAEQASADTWEQDEPSAGNDLIRVYPVRTFLSRCLTTSDCVVDVLPVIRHAKGNVLKPEILESLAKLVPKVENPNRFILLLKLQYSNEAQKIVGQLMEDISKKKKMARSLGFRNLYLQTSWAE